jgi:hypothetical protein
MRSKAKEITAAEEVPVLSNLLLMLHHMKECTTKQIRQSSNFSKNLHILAVKASKYQHGRSYFSLDASIWEKYTAYIFRAEE